MKKFYIITLLVFFGLSIHANAQTPNFLWAKQMGGATTDRGYSIAVDANGNVYTTGAFTGTADFNPSTDPNTGIYNLTAVGNYDIFISKLDASGNFLWAKNIGGTSADYGYSIAVDANGYIYTTGYFQGTADFNPGNGVNNLTSAGNEDIFVSKLDASGNFVWAKSFSGSNSQIGYSIAVNSIGNVYTTGYFESTVDFDPGAGAYNLTSVGYYDVFVSALDASGNFLWAKRMGGGSSSAGCGAVCSGSSGKSIAIDGNGNVYTAGYFPGTGDFDPGADTFNLSASGFSSYSDIFISKLDPSGNFVWAKQMGGIYGEGANSIAIDANSNVYTTGIFGSTSDFDPGNGVYDLTPTGSGTNTFISKLDASGNFVWAKSIGGGTGTCGGPCLGSSGNAIVTDTNGNVYTTGYFRGAPDFDPGPEMHTLTTSNGSVNFDIFVSKLNASGNYQWAIQMGGPSGNSNNLPYDNGNAIALDANENIYVSGSFYFTADFDPGNGIYNLVSGNNPNNTYEDIFVVKLCQITTPIITGPTSFCQDSSVILTSSSSNSYLWSNGATTQSITVSSSGNYSVTVTNANGCTAASTVTTVIVNPIPTVTVNSQTICSGQSATLTASGATSYQWSNGMTGSPITVSPASSTTYSVTGTTAGCSSAPASAQVTVNLVPTVSVNSPTICAGQSATLTASGATTYLWSNGMTGSTITVNPASSTNYTVTGTTAGCSSTPASAQVTVNLVPTVSVNSPTICAGQSATLTANGATTYLWSNGMTGSTITVNPASSTNYTVTGTTANCSSLPATAQVIVNPTPTITVTVNNPTICAGQSATLTASGATSYQWSNGMTGSPITVSPASSTTYSVTGTTAGCVSAPVSAQVMVNPVPTVTVNSPTICAGQSATLTANGATTYLWSNGMMGSPITVSPANSTAYTVTGTTAGCSSLPATAQVTVSLTLLVTVNSPTICSGQSATLTASGATTYQWSNGMTGSPIVVNPTSSTTYTVTGTTANCSSLPATAQVTVNPLPTVTVNSPTICAGQSATLTANGATTYLWSNGMTGSTITVNPASSTNYTVTGTTAGCASAPASAQVTVNPVPTVTVNSPTICAGQSATLTASGATTYLWSNGMTGSPITVSPASTTTYTVTGTMNGCSGTASVTVTVNPVPTVTATGSTTICAGNSTSLNAGGATDYNWSPSTGLSCTNCPSPTASPTTTTTYTVTGTMNNCSGTASLTVTVNPVPTVTATATGSTTICAGNSTSLNAGGATDYNWSPSTGLSCTNCPSPTANPASTTTYTVTGTTNGCIAAANITITVTQTPLCGGINGSTTVCQSSTQPYSVSCTNSTSYNWTVPSDWTINSGQGTSLISVTVGSSPGQVCITPLNDDCPGTQVCLNNVTVTQTPLCGGVSGVTSVCQSSTQNYSIFCTNATSYNWTIPTGWSINLGQGTSSITVTVGANSGQVCATSSNGSCTGSQTCTNASVIFVDTSVNQNQNPPTLTANASPASYQWLDCNNGMQPISPPQTNQSFTATQTGSYSVIVTQNGCMDTSICYSITISGTDELTSITDLKIYPNPNTGRFTVSLKSDEIRNVEILCSNLLGQSIFSKKYNLNNGELKTELDLSAVGKGVYLIQVRSDGKSVFRKITIVE